MWRYLTDESALAGTRENWPVMSSDTDTSGEQSGRLHVQYNNTILHHSLNTYIATLHRETIEYDF